MDVFDLRDTLIKDYADYSGSFVRIRDSRIKNHVQAELESTLLWPDPLRYFPTPRDAVDYIMETFPIVKKKDIKAHGRYRTKVTILEIYDDKQRAIDTGIPYQTRLDPPPGPPTDAESNIIPMEKWDDLDPHLISHIHPPKEGQ
ncbi:unnamed protein product [marine sediment metagenome]|uniref:Uncharacterized protein n=1 Tax=marine sediment metagenome TaxID=412755 RepID=X1SZK3_9ZZZZ